MSDTAAQALIDRIENDEAFAQRLADLGSPDAVLAAARDEGYPITPEAMRDAVLDRYGDQLTPEQLDLLAGGADVTWVDIAFPAVTLTALVVAAGAV